MQYLEHIRYPRRFQIMDHHEQLRAWAMVPHNHSEFITIETGQQVTHVLVVHDLQAPEDYRSHLADQVMASWSNSIREIKE